MVRKSRVLKLFMLSVLVILTMSFVLVRHVWIKINREIKLQSNSVSKMVDGIPHWNFIARNPLIERLESSKTVINTIAKVQYNHQPSPKKTDVLDKTAPTVIKITKQIPNILSKDVDPERKLNIHLVNSKDIEPFQGQILILVTSFIGNRKRRDSIRQNWGDKTKFIKERQELNNLDYKVYFMTGYLGTHIKQAEAESAIFKDMLITNRTEDYWDFSRRVMFGFLWSLENCQFDYLLKADDDIFLNMPNLFKLLYTDPKILANKGKLYAGSIYIGHGPKREKSNKWYVSREEWAPRFYPPFATGMGFILSRYVVEKIRPHFDWLKPFRLDDVYVGMLVDRAKIPDLFIRRKKSENEFAGFNEPHECLYLNGIVYHKVTDNWCMKNLTNKSLI